MATEEKIHQVLKLTTDIQWLKIHGGSWKKNIKRGTSKTKQRNITLLEYLWIKNSKNSCK